MLPPGFDLVELPHLPRMGGSRLFDAEGLATADRALLRDHRPQDIGIYGCSAGGYLTAQAVARLISKQLPLPGAIGTFCGTGAPYSGDTPFLSGPLDGAAPRWKFRVLREDAVLASGEVVAA